MRYPQEKSLFQELFEREKQVMSESESIEVTLRRLVGVMDPVQARVAYELHIR